MIQLNVKSSSELLIMLMNDFKSSYSFIWNLLDIYYARGTIWYSKFQSLQPKEEQKA